MNDRQNLSETMSSLQSDVSLGDLKKPLIDEHNIKPEMILSEEDGPPKGE